MFSTRVALKCGEMFDMMRFESAICRKGTGDVDFGREPRQPAPGARTGLGC